uniref:Replication factor A C-terminal domain-containing protein n=1 Tax=Chenopodium quinoa TaxID=63459 RepID=A0A803MXM3_CHEQI
MRGTLFGDQIEAFEDALQYIGEYDISAAPIRFIDEKWRTEIDQFPYQMTFGSRTVIQPIHPELGPVLPDYKPLASIPRAIDPDEKYDPKYFDKLSNWAETFKVIGFRALKPNTRRGFSMNSGMSTRIVYEPKGNRATVLSDWANLFYQRVVDRQARVLEIRYPSENRKILSIAELKQKKPSNTLQEEVLWIEVTIENAELEKVNAYTGCSNCWKRTNLPLQKRYSCAACSNKECISTERITFKFEARDDTGTMAFTTFNDDTERLFRKTAATIYAIKEADDQDAFRAIQDMLSSTPFYIKVGPTQHLGQNNVLEWTLKTIELKESLDIEQNIQDTVTNFDQGKDSMEKHS